MSESIPRFIVLYALMVLSGCSGSNQNNDSSAVASEVPSEELKNVNDLTYMEVVELVFKDEGEGVEWHGEALPNELKEALLIEEGGPCGEHDCGKIVNIRNTSDKTIVAITRGDFDINEEQGYLARNTQSRQGRPVLWAVHIYAIGARLFHFREPLLEVHIRISRLSCKS